MLKFGNGNGNVRKTKDQLYILLFKKFVPEVFVHKEFTTTIGSRQLDERIAVKMKELLVLGKFRRKSIISLLSKTG